MATKKIYCLVAPVATYPASGIYGCSSVKAKAERALAAMEKLRGNAPKIFGIVERDSTPKHLKPGFWNGGTQLANHDRATSFGTILFVGERRKDGKTPVTYVFQSTGSRANKLLSDEQLVAAKAKATDVRRKSR